MQGVLLRMTLNTVQETFLISSTDTVVSIQNIFHVLQGVGGEVLDQCFVTTVYV